MLVLIILNIFLLGAFAAYFACVHTGKLQGMKGETGPQGIQGEPGRCCANCNEGYSGQCYVWKPKIIEAVERPPCEVGETVPPLPGEKRQELPDNYMENFKDLPSPDEIRRRIADGEKPEDIMRAKNLDMALNPINEEVQPDETVPNSQPS